MSAVCLPKCDDQKKLVRAAKRDGYRDSPGGWIAHATMNGADVVPRFGTKRVADMIAVTDASGATIGMGRTRASALESAVKALDNADRQRASRE
jgi:hypothetical protein